jgi:putative DNA primase/helicase
MSSPHQNQQQRYLASALESRVPALLMGIPQWITWTAGNPEPDGKFAKRPKGRDGTGSAWQTAGQWMSFEESLRVARDLNRSGVGLVLPAKTADGKFLVALDFDGVDLTDPASVRINEIMALHELLGHPYIEKSPSGKGLRMFVLSSVPLPQVSVANPLGGKDELFCASPKWVTVTGFSKGGTGVPDATEEIGRIAHEWQARSGAKAQAEHRTDRGGMLSHLTGGWAGWPENKLRDGDGREETMLAFAGHLRAKGLPQDEIERQCLEANQEHYEAPLNEDVVLDRARRYQQETAKEAAQQSEAVLEQVDQTDAGNVARMYELSKGAFRFVYEQELWIHWTGNRWQYDSTRSALHKLTLQVAGTYAQKARRIQKEIDDPSTSDVQRKGLKSALESLKKWVIQCRDRRRLESMIALAQRDPRFVISASELDRDPRLMGVANGVVCLRTGVLSPENKGDFILRRSPVAFNPNASTVAIQKFVAEVTSCTDGIENGKVKARARPALARYVQKFGGYCLTGLISEQVMFMPSGRGSNGKNVLIDALRDVAGDYCEVMPPEILLATKDAKSAEQASPVTRKLAGARCAVTSENKEGARLDVAVVKRHTGDSKMTARDVYEKSVTFDITHKLVLLTNHPPRVDHMDDAIKGRLHVIPFDMRWNRPGTTEYDPTIPDADKGLPAKLKAEAEGVLRFFVEGAVLYFKEGLSPPAEVTAFTQGYITAQDTVRRWLVDECIQCEEGEGTTAAQLHASYRSFCLAEGEREQADNPATLGRRLGQMGYQGRKTREGKVYPLKPKGQLTPAGMAFMSLATPGSHVM